jgi:hypothetical protein
MDVISYRRRRIPKLRLALGLIVALVLATFIVNLGSSTYLETGASKSHLTKATSAPTTLPADSATGLTAQWVTDENAKPGTTDWNLSGNQVAGSIEGYADHVSTVQGQAVTLYVSTVAPTFQVNAYRMGWYGGTLGRLVWTSPTVTGIKQSSCPRTGGTNTIECSWQPSLTITPDSSWPPGDYLLKLVGSGNQQSYIPLTLRDDASHAPIVIQNSVTTWQAYNLWGGYDLYQGLAGHGTSFADRARAVSFDRPYSFDFGGGAADFIGNELPLVSLAEHEGLNVTYWTDVDLEERPQLLMNHRVLVSLGHDEYWSSTMRQEAEFGRDHGINLMFLGANAVYRHIRFAPSPLGADRLEIDYKSASEDPLYGRDNSQVTVNWPDPPLNQPESELIGDMYDCNPVSAAMSISDASAWVFAGTNVQNGTEFPGLVGSEYDRYFPGLPGPRNIQILAHSFLRCRGISSFSDMTYYTAPTGAGVFATGTNVWVGSLSRLCPASTTACPGDFTRQVTTNVLQVFATAPAGQTHPSQPNWTTLPGYSTSATAVGEQ